MKILSRDLGFYNYNILDRTVTRTGFRLANLVDNIHPFDHLAEDRVLVHRGNCC